jgi:hypothetical protein
MDIQKRATIYLDSSLHRALKLKAAASDRSISEIVTEAVRRALSEDAIDLAASEERAREPDLDFAAVVKSLRRRGRI